MSHQRAGINNVWNHVFLFSGILAKITKEEGLGKVETKALKLSGFLGFFYLSGQSATPVLTILIKRTLKVYVKTDFNITFHISTYVFSYLEATDCCFNSFEN